ncbi:hypothetical protein MA16_Dca000236 [Dendrobium catenatum]|uniref:Reverse transcriptase domain-containing protein n=1 Tax=Dendrobium catenatum TaxID=906689 RepID=A0A2I0WTA2_9ASPA|nr:hypothetical protein MA16_Dca000236 [Dendrobium catenatum]
MPYNLCFGTEAVIPIDIGVPSHRVQTFDSNTNDEKLRNNLDLLPEVRDETMLNIEAAGKGPQQNKLSPLWEGPYLVAAMVKPGTFKLKDAEGKMLPRTWNIDNLRKYYQ